MHGHDSKVHVSDYKVGGHNVLYSSAEVFTWSAQVVHCVFETIADQMPGSHMATSQYSSCTVERANTTNLPCRMAVKPRSGKAMVSKSARRVAPLS